MVGEQMPRVINGQTNTPEHLLQDNLLNECYKSALGFPMCGKQLSQMVSQIANRYPNSLHTIEVGSGTGGATRNVLSSIGHNFASYTYADISSGSFKSAEEEFQSRSTKLSFKVLDIEASSGSQGFTEYSYDIVAASIVLHATTDS